MTTEAPVYAQVDGSRVRILDAPILAPGTCAICGTSRNDDRKYLDLGLDVDYVGVMYFCTFCFTELINMLGYKNPEQIQVLEDELETARHTIFDFQSTKAKYDAAIDTLRSTGLFNGASLVDAAPEQEFDTDFSVPEPKPRGTNKPTKQSNSKQGSASIPATGSNDLESFL